MVLFAVSARVAERRMGEFIPQNLVNTAWAFATSGQSDLPLSIALARAMEYRV